jgi:hypothetical protein
VKTANWVIEEDVVISFSIQDHKTVPKGSFVTPVSFEYVPKHVKDDIYWKPFRKETEVFCYTRYGFIKIEKSKLREVQ